ncbi:hypothetical protein Poli38472_011364 [Pythium oligandrum]|uniref:Uncharacterized protein n=1 Tax=Pythium oligandrum TaxID=41045 RepID=A0A8K1FKS0_PYTOL|nr:hypothetical protein Poli38472_011364 [Pythium oligandrum]|eukprot:TMW64484.1 hypothetical protein Poli38472_011364 [Pythium oligandrum]
MMLRRFAASRSAPWSAVRLRKAASSALGDSHFSGVQQMSTTATKSFAALGLNERLVTALKEMGIENPTGIQEKSIPAILSGNDIMCTAQTGTGKTLAYMVPVVENLHRAEVALSEEDKKKILPARPQVLVLLPSRELALQVGDVAKQLAHSAKFASTTITAGERKSIQQRSLSRHLDMVIGTPGRVAKCIDKGDFYVSRITTIVLDEADTLMDAKMGFRKELDEVLRPIQASAAKRKEPLQVILVAATIRSPLDKVFKKKFGDLRLVSDDKIHQTPSTLQEEFIRTSPENKQSALREALHLRRSKHAKTVIFCRNAASCRATDHMLREHGFRSLCLHGDMPSALRTASVDTFQESEDMNILVCTDLAARGLHFDNVKHVIMCDFPRSAVDYVHRAGRAGRAGEEGFVTSLVTKHDIELARTIEEAKTNRKVIRDLRSNGEAAIPSLEPLRLDDDQRQPGAQAPKKKKKVMIGHGTKRLKQHKIRRL